MPRRWSSGRASASTATPRRAQGRGSCRRGSRRRLRRPSRSARRKRVRRGSRRAPPPHGCPRGLWSRGSRLPSVEGHDTPGKEPELHALEAATAELVREILRAGEATHARWQVRVRGPAGEEAAQQRHDAVEPELVEGREEPARCRYLEDAEPAAGTKHAAQLPDGSLEVLDVANPEAHDR